MAKSEVKSFARCDNKETKGLTGWDFIIANGTKQLCEVEALAARLRTSLEYFEKRRASGDEFPGEERLRQVGLI